MSDRELTQTEVDQLVAIQAETNMEHPDYPHLEQEVKSKEIILPRTCTVCGTLHKIVVKLADYEKWKAGTLIQDAFPYLDAGQRETLMSNTCGSCFDAIFSEDEDII